MKETDNFESLELKDLVCEENIWDFLSLSNKPIMIYGMGNGADKIIDTLKEYGVEVSEIFASDEFVRGHSFRGKKVKKYSDICREYSDFNVVLAFATHLDDVMDNIKSINSKHPVFAPDVPVAGDGLFTKEYFRQNYDKFNKVYSLLADNESKRVYADIINFKISGKVSYLYNSFCDKDSVYRDILQLNRTENIIDCGAYDGDTIREFTGFTQNKYNSITALEPDAKNFRKLTSNASDMQGVRLYNKGVWNKCDTLIFAGKSGRNSHLSGVGNPVEVVSIDSLEESKDVTMIKMDIEGSELKALEGAKDTIASRHPKLYICAYHRNEDLFSLPLKINELYGEYKIYFRHSPYIPAWESNFYCTT